VTEVREAPRARRATVGSQAVGVRPIAPPSERSASRDCACPDHLFVACSDAATPFWARQTIWEASTASAIWRAEASLLLDTIRKKPEDSEHRDSFLGYRVRDMELVIPPWRRPVEWDDIDITDNDEED
ncbi:MAG: hypothetical protein M3Q69_18885, partial [Acidobacteriota bacterium]|nr:hypothetical protein [Acidobacteriota bacterium]